MHKKAQVTLFLIIGITIIIGLSYAMYNSGISKRAKVTVETEKLSSLKLQINPLNNFMSRCVNDVLKNNLDQSGLNAQKLSNQLQNQIQTTCDLQTFQERGIEIQTKPPEVQVEVKHNQVIIVRVKYPLTLKDQEETLTLSDFATSLPLQTQQRIPYNPVNPTQTLQTVTLLATNGKMGLEIAAGTTFMDASGNTLTPAQVGITLEDHPQTSANPNDHPSQLSYHIQLYDADHNPLPVATANHPTDSTPLQVTYYTDILTIPSLLYTYNSNPLNPQWETTPSQTLPQELRYLTPKQEDKAEDLTNKILSSNEFTSTQSASLESQFTQLQNTPEKSAQDNLLAHLESQLPADNNNLQRRFDDLQQIYQNAPTLTQTTTTLQTRELNLLDHLKETTQPPQQPPTLRTDTEIARSNGFEEQTPSTCDHIGALCCSGNLCQNNLHCRDGICQACSPDCFTLDHTCGDDGCEGSCGSCEVGQSCQEGICVLDQLDFCGDDTCQDEENCGNCLIDCACPSEQSCTENRCMINECAPICMDGTNPRPCGFPDRCGGICDGASQKCLSGQFCNQGQCIPLTNSGCIANCEAKQCGEPNGCGGNCIVQTCTGAQVCIFDHCRSNPYARAAIT
ncbi:MAG TPA: hypothetical protein VJG90_02215 [Candidatus Nanoarchaeia archaeon]|nr:hypothetical protein [Candidatus Nanoarchaeia archaeon]